MNDDISCEDRWPRYRRLRVAYWLLVSSAPLWFLLSYEIAVWRLQGFAMRSEWMRSLTYGGFTIMPWCFAVASARHWFRSWSCPRCTRPFFAGIWWKPTLLIRECHWCGLPKYECPEDGPSEPPEITRRDAESYSQAWNRYRTLNRAFWVTLAVLPLLFLATAAVAALMPARILQAIGFVVCVLGTVALFIRLGYLNFMLHGWRCPRCCRPYFVRWWTGYVPFVRKCMHCGLPKWSTDDPDRQSTE